MIEPRLEVLTTQELTERFAELGVAQDDALLRDRFQKYNTLFDQLEAIANELKRRPLDQRTALLALFRHSNMQVRVNAAKATLAVAPDVARRELEEVAALNWHPQSLNAGMCLSALDRGVFKPT
jgi:hypothetical protein